MTVKNTSVDWKFHGYTNAKMLKAKNKKKEIQSSGFNPDYDEIEIFNKSLLSRIENTLFGVSRLPD